MGILAGSGRGPAKGAGLCANPRTAQAPAAEATAAETGSTDGTAAQAQGSGAPPNGPVRIGSKDFTEAILVAELYAQVLLARQAGYAQVSEEFEHELVGVSAPVRDFRGRVVAALNVSAPKFRLGGSIDAAGRAAIVSANQISFALGWVGSER